MYLTENGKFSGPGDSCYDNNPVFPKKDEILDKVIAYQKKDFAADFISATQALAPQYLKEKNYQKPNKQG
jgi:hypothetical protein